MKTLKLILILMIFVGSINAQNQYYDALELKKKMIDNELYIDDSIMLILKNYYPSISDVTSIDSIVKDNPFLADIKFISAKSIDESFRELEYKSIISKLGGINVTTFTQGLSLFLIERAKEELNVAFFQKFKDFFEKEENKEIRILFPITTEKISGLLAFQYPEMLPVLQEAFQRDMNNLPGNIINVLLLPDHFNEIKDHPEFLILIKLFGFLNQFNLYSPPELIEKLPAIAQFDSTAIDTLPGIQNLYSILKITEIISHSLLKQTDTINGQTGYWVSFAEFNQNILRDAMAQKIYFGLLWMQIEKEKLTINRRRLDGNLITGTVEQEIYWFSNFITKVLLQFEVINESAGELKSQMGKQEQPLKNDLYGYVNTTLNLTELGIEVAQHLNANEPGHMRYISLVQNGNELIRNTFSKNYTLAINNALTLLDTLSNTNKKKAKGLLTTQAMRKMYTYGRFIGSVAEAKDPEEVKVAISALIMPTGSSSIKKYQWNNLSINAYLGASAMLFSDNASTSKTWTNTIGITAPIGLNWAFGSMRKGGSLSLFASLLDIGAVVDYQLTDSTQSSFEQKIYLENILSPGAYIVYGFGDNIPLALSFGGQYGPGLTKIGNDLKKPTWRLNVTLTVDIPMINLNQGRRR
jgi:hypothetical protein